MPGYFQLKKYIGFCCWSRSTSYVLEVLLSDHLLSMSEYKLHLLIALVLFRCLPPYSKYNKLCYPTLAYKMASAEEPCKALIKLSYSEHGQTILA